MKTIILVLLSLSMLTGCSLFGTKKRAPEVVASCFSDGENQELYCKAKRTNEYGKIVVTRCIGTQNREAHPQLRGKCVEKICSEGSNTDCEVRGEFAVLQQYAELMTSNLFTDDESAAVPKRNTAVKTKSKVKSKTSLKAAAVEEVSTDPTVRLAVEPVEEVPTPTPQPAQKRMISSDLGTSPAPMSISLKPVKSKARGKGPASVQKPTNGFKKVCVGKGDIAAPKVLRGKCATRTCANGKCAYQGRKEMFDWVSQSDL